MAGGFAGLAGIAARQRGLFPPPGPDLPERLRDALGVLALSAADVRVERRWTDGDLAGEELSWTVGFGPRTRAPTRSFPAEGVRRAHRQITGAYRDAPGRYTGAFFDAGHEFDRTMQDAAFDWLAGTAGGIEKALSDSR